MSTVTLMPTLEFKGKQHIYAHHLTVPHRPLIVDSEKSSPQPQNRGGGGYACSKLWSARR